MINGNPNLNDSQLKTLRHIYEKPGQTKYTIIGNLPHADRDIGALEMYGFIKENRQYPKEPFVLHLTEDGINYLTDLKKS